jgi:Permuted papain-like amidase enzyme, YaeF/YiiX, C92 family
MDVRLFYLFKMKQFQLLYFITALISVSSCNNGETSINTADEKQQQEQLAINKTKQTVESITDGDLILRDGRGYTSDAIRDFSLADKNYSHCGIAITENDTLFIYHVYTGKENPSGLMQREPIYDFIDKGKNKGFAVYRYNLDSPERKKFITDVQKKYLAQVKFDMDFNLDTDDKQYCAEMISKSIGGATLNRIKIPHSQIAVNSMVVKYLNRFPEMKKRIEKYKTKKLEYIAIDNLYLNEFCKKIETVTYPE